MSKTRSNEARREKAGGSGGKRGEAGRDLTRKHETALKLVI